MGYFDDIQIPNIPAFAPRQQRKPNILDRVLGLYGSDPNTHIPAGQRNEALRTGLGAGASALRQAGLQGVPMSAFERIGLALGGMGQAGPLMAEQQKKQQLEALLMSGSPADLQMAMRTALASGDTQTAQILSQHLASQATAKAAGAGSKARGQLTTIPMEDGSRHQVLIDMVTGEVLKDYGEAQPEQGVVVERYNPQTGVVEKVLVDKRTGEDIKRVGQDAPEMPSLQEEALATRATLVRAAVTDVQNAIAELDRGPALWEWHAYKHDISRGAVPDQVQGLLQAEEALISHLAVVVTGSVRAAASEPIREAIFRSYLVAPGDSPLNREQTLRNLEMIAQRLETEAGRAYLRSNMRVPITDDMILALGENPGGAGGVGGTGADTDVAGGGGGRYGTYPGDEGDY